VIKAMNALMMSLAAIPTYLIARRVLQRNMALLASGFAVAIPSMVYTGMVLTESAFYPAFLLAVLTILRATERPTALRQFCVFGAIGFAFLVRAQAVVLVAAYVGAIVWLAWLESERGNRSQRAREIALCYRTTWLSLLGGAVLLVATQLARGRSTLDLLGAYQVVVGDMRPLGIPRWFLYHLADLDLYLGVVPFIACCIVFPSALRGVQGRPFRVFAVTTVSLSFSMILLVSAFSSSDWGLGRLHERNLFYIVPLLLIAFLGWIQIGAPRPSRLTAGSALVAAALPPMLPFAALFIGSVVDALALIAWATNLMRPSVVPVAIGVFAGTLALLFVLLPRRLAPFLLVVTALNLYFVGNHASWHAQDSSRALADVRVDRDWIDAAVGPNADVAAVWFPNRLVCTPRAERGARLAALWENEFFNRSVRKTYYVVQAAPDNLPAKRLAVDSGTRLLRTAENAAFSPQLIALGDGVRLRARVVATDPQTNTILYRYNRNAQVIPPANCPTFRKAFLSG
jgi:hypothetical protein